VKFFTLISIVVVTAAVSACGSSSSSDEGGQAASAATTTAKLLKPQAKPVLVPPKGPPPKKLVIRDLKAGSGPTARSGDKVTAEYTGFNFVNHEEFTNHAHDWGKGEPLVFTIGGGEVLKGMDQGVVGMKVGGRRELVVPPDLAYGNEQPPPEVGPNETVIFVVELLGIG
jgi:peptidylprolyl isomerase